MDMDNDDDHDGGLDEPSFYDLLYCTPSATEAELKQTALTKQFVAQSTNAYKKLLPKAEEEGNERLFSAIRELREEAERIEMDRDDGDDDDVNWEQKWKALPIHIRALLY